MSGICVEVMELKGMGRCEVFKDVHQVSTPHTLPSYLAITHDPHTPSCYHTSHAGPALAHPGGGHQE